jgi:hypothetical protein
MPTKRRQIARRCRLTWVAQVLAEGRPPMDYTEWQEFQRWRQGQLAVPGLPDPQSPGGKRFIATLRVSLR